jgi:uncharacterized protein (DUF2236 family)
MYGQRALCIGALSPLNYVGTAEHSYAQLTPFRRLVHTGHAFEKIYFGARAEADRVLAYVRGLHEDVRGTLAEAARITPKGTSYSALDPALMLWTVAVIADSAQRFYELLVRGLAGWEREALWQDYLRFGENTEAFDRVAATERSRIERGQPTPQIRERPTPRPALPSPSRHARRSA